MNRCAPVPPAPPPRSYRLTTPNAPGSAAVARRVVGALLHGAALDPLRDDAVLCTDELVGNACRYTRTPRIRVAVTFGRDGLRVHVHDDAPLRPPVLRAAGPLETGGRGLALVEALSDEWGWAVHGTPGRPRSKSVWFGFDLRGRGIVP
ncbi:ATP-binding protein [Streptomyces sp. NPDC001941]|uniref:ATP-binding protein n=1 Tax=Streptomyces sp. NPDC001941 TaxID=3154659 RepID=UPI00331A2CA2